MRRDQEDKRGLSGIFMGAAMGKGKRALLMMFFFIVFLVLFFVGLLLLVTYMFSTLIPIDLYELWALLMGYQSVQAIDAIDLFFIGLFTFAGGAFVVAIGREIKQRNRETKGKKL